MILERATGLSVSEFTQTRLWETLGMEFGGSWSLDSIDSNFEKMEAGLNARAIDFAKFGRLFLSGGQVNGEPVVSEAWIAEMTAQDAATHRAEYYPSDWGQVFYSDGGGFYGHFVYGSLRENATPDIFAEGDRGQYIYVSPSRELIIVRLGLEYGMSSAEWIEGFYNFASES